ncbi:hypothetical protein AO265_35165 [Pseudomonas sp. ABAC61]|nr:hypothetical protein AO265_35165 [Pseudomonas sp. ABAC61]
MVQQSVVQLIQGCLLGSELATAQGMVLRHSISRTGEASSCAASMKDVGSTRAAQSIVFSPINCKVTHMVRLRAPRGLPSMRQAVAVRLLGQVSVLLRRLAV